MITAVSQTTLMGKYVDTHKPDAVGAAGFFIVKLTSFVNSFY